MKLQFKSALAVTAIAAALMVSASSAMAAFPERAITLVVPFSPGGGSDILGRLVGQKMSEFLGQEVVVDNRPGAAGTLGTDAVSRADPDGYTMLLINTIAHSAAAIITPEVQYSSVDNFTAVGAIGDTQYMLIENPDFAPDYAAAIEKIKASPGTYNFASSGIGSAPHLVMELFMAKAGLDMVHIPYGGSGPALNDVVAGTVPLMFENVAAVELIKAGQLKALATTGDERQETFPDVPTFTEVGLKDFDIAAHWGLIAPAGVSADIIETLNSALNKALQDPEIAKSLATQGIAAKPGPAEDYNKLLASEATRWKGVIEDAGIHP